MLPVQQPLEGCVSTGSLMKCFGHVGLFWFYKNSSHSLLLYRSLSRRCVGFEGNRLLCTVFRSSSLRTGGSRLDKVAPMKMFCKSDRPGTVLYLPEVDLAELRKTRLVNTTVATRSDPITAYFNTNLQPSSHDSSCRMARAALQDHKRPCMLKNSESANSHQQKRLSGKVVRSCPACQIRQQQPKYW